MICECGCGLPVANRFRRGHQRRLIKRQRGYPQVHRNGKPIEVHAVIAEMALGRPLPPGTEIHHVDGSQSNNANTNLVICQDSAYHKLLHIRTKVVRAGGDANTMKMCDECNCVKPFDAFARSSLDKSTGRQSRCRECQRRRDKAKYLKMKKSCEEMRLAR